MSRPPCKRLPDQLAALAPGLYRRARGLTATPEDAADLAQDAWLRLWQQHKTGPRIQNPDALATTILRNLARSRWRDRRQFDPLEDDMLTTPPDAPRVIAQAELCAAINRLPKAQADLLHFVELGEHSPARLADLTGNPVGTVMSRLARARVRLRRELGLSRSCSVTSLFQDPADP